MGTFYGPNITPDPGHGVGRWTEADFLRALGEGVAPDGSPYYPVFPYTAYTRMRADDARALWAYLASLPPVAEPDRQHDLPWYLRWRTVVHAWRWLHFQRGEWRDDPGRPPEWNRGAYLAEGMAHCGECHTPRDRLGGLDLSRRYAGTREGPEGAPAPNITPDRETGIGRWRVGDLADFLSTGATPGGDFTGGLMAEVVKEGTRHLTEGDRMAIGTYVLSLPAVSNRLERRERPRDTRRGEFE
jgi:mono/diheme cytochrome c family protein